MKIWFGPFTLALLFLAGCYPSATAIDAAIVEIRESKGDRYALVAKLLEELRDPGTTNEAGRGRAGVSRLADTYLETQDVEILRAVDNTHGGMYFTFMLCEFYSKVIDDPVVRARYQPRDPQIARCQNQTWPHGEISSKLTSK